MFEILSSYEVRALAAALMLALGARLFLHGASNWARRGDALQKVVWFRRGIVGLAMVGIGVWLLTGQLWVLILSLGIAGEELLETSFMITFLRRERRQRQIGAKAVSAQPRQPIPAS